jgi:hypothetical protein
MDDRLALELLLTRSGIWEARFRSIETAGQAAVKQNRHFWTMRHEKLTSSGPGPRSNTSPRPNRDGSLAAGEGLREMPRVTRRGGLSASSRGRAGRLGPRDAWALGAARGAWTPGVARPDGRVRRVTTRDELDALSSRELHDLAVRRALHHTDVEFLWELLRALPAAEAVEGHTAHAGEDISKVSALIADAIDSGKGDLAEALRPLYLDYLVKHSTGS